MDRGAETFDAALAASTLDWWREAGVDTLVGESPRDWLARSVVPEPEPIAPGPAVLPQDLAGLRHMLATQDDLPFAGPGTTRVLPAGDPASGLMMLADMPTGEDAANGAIFSGESGALFEAMLRAIGLERGGIYLASLSCLAAPGGRLDGESAAQCGALARRHVALASPRRLLLLGEAATRALLDLDLPAARGRVHNLDLGGAERVAAVATYHPRYLLIRPLSKAGAWADLLLFNEGIE